MTTHDYVLANQSGSSFRSDLNNALAAIVSQNSSASEPATKYAYQYWVDTSVTPALIKQRNAANDGWITLSEVGGQLLAADGTAAKPGIAFAADVNTGLKRNAADEVGLVTGGVERVTVDTSGKVGIGTSSPLANLNVKDDTNYTPSLTYTDGSLLNLNYSQLHASIGISSNSPFPLYIQNKDQSGNARNITLNPLGGNVVIGTTNSSIGQNSTFSVDSVSPANVLSISRQVNDSTGPRLFLTKTRGTETSSVSSGDTLGDLRFNGSDGTDVASIAASIAAQVDGTPGSNDMPGRLTFSTTGDGAASPTERIRINSSGKVGIGTSSPGATLDVNGRCFIGRPSTFWTSGNDYFNVGDVGSLTSQGSFAVDLTSNGYRNSSGTWTSFSSVTGQSGACLIRLLPTGNIEFKTDASKASGTGVNPTLRMTLNSSGNLTVTGSLSKGSGSFKIDHPLPELTETHHLVHSFVEAPDASNLYAGMVDLVNGTATVNIDTAHRMTEGTFEALNTLQSWSSSNESGYAPVKCSVSGNLLTIECQDATSADTVYYEVRGVRKDQHMIDTEWTDSSGLVIVEPEKIVESEE